MRGWKRTNIYHDNEIPRPLARMVYVLFFSTLVLFLAVVSLMAWFFLSFPEAPQTVGLQPSKEASREELDPQICGLSVVSCPEEAVEGQISPKTATVEVSCYTGYESHGANGREDGISVATYRYPIGTWLLIEGVGKRRVDTRTAKEYGDRIDVWLGDGGKELHDYCLNEFGTKQLTVKPL